MLPKPGDQEKRRAGYLRAQQIVTEEAPWIFLWLPQDLYGVQYEQWDEKTARATGARFVPLAPPMVKLEGAGKVGERRLAIVGIRDPYTIENIDKAMA